ncbi:MAG TPA: porin family protein [Bacteroidales bacterium]|nr:porin family protein [Bacteroidales bacterium]
MKKIVLALILFAAFAFVSNAQNEKFFRFGLHANTGLIWMKPDQDSLEYQGMKIGLGWGFIGELTIADNFSFATGFDINYMGGKLQKLGVLYTFDGDTVPSLASVTSNYRFQFLDIPLTLKMKTNEINYITYFARIGGSIGICLNAKADQEYSPLSGDRKETISDQDLKDEKKFLRANFLISGGLEYSLGGTTTALAELSFVNGLTYQLEDTKSIGNYIMLKFGIMF